MRRLVFGLVLLLLPVVASAQTAAVKKNVNLRPTPSTAQQEIRLLKPPETLTLLSTTKTSGYYNVRTAENETGWVWAPNVTVSNSGGVSTFMAPPANSCSNPETCGKERWTVKTLTDEDAGKVKFTPKATTVEKLLDMAAPAKRPKTKRVVPTELITFRVHARLIGFKSEDDHDIHVVLADPDDAEMTFIAEIPDPTSCTFACSSAKATEMIAARKAFTDRLDVKECYSKVSGKVPVTVTGVGFFDKLHSQTGVAENGFELHPVLKFEFDNQSAITAKCGG